MSFISFFKKERNRLLLETLSTAIAVLIALTIDSIADFYREQNNFHTMLHAMRLEAKANQYILENSFKPNYEKAIVYRTFNLKTVEEYWVSPIFVEHASTAQLDALSQYYLSLGRSNALREAGELYAYDEKLNAKFGDKLRQTWKNNLEECEKGIKAVIAIEE
jgi:hypothetical protein